MPRIRIIVAVIISFSLFALLQGCSRPARGNDVGGRVVITVWHPWGGTQAIACEQVIKAFEAAHPKIDVRPLFTVNDLSNNQKFFTSVAAGKPPDVTFVDGPQVAEWAEQGALTPLDDFIKSAGIKAGDYFKPCWLQNQYKGRVWALTYCADPNFAFVWNKAHFREVGLDPEKPPATIEELDYYVEKLTKWRGTGKGRKLVRIGIIPWSQYGAANSMFTWGWAFGASFYDPVTHTITADDERAVKALEWMCSYARKYDVNKISSLEAGFGSAEMNPFYVGKYSMACLHISGVEEIKKYAPNLDYGLGYIPAPPDGEQHSSWVGGWCVAIPKGCRHPKEAWEFIRWTCADPEGTRIVGEKTGLFPGYRKSPYFAKVRRNPQYGMFLRILEECRHQRPVMPAQAYYMGALQRAVDAAIYGRKSPKQALFDARVETQRELDLVMGKEK
ncbi:MAG: ABC transporter substrate-binding protein [Armatimonadota bacterium]|nr:ABC transporter substrate-binding protein [Armatimonadota bacterium]